LKSALDALVVSGDVEAAKSAGPPRPTGPLLAMWVREKLDAR